MKNQVLVCTCGDCDDWVIGQDKSGAFIKCMTCKVKYPAKIDVTEHPNLRYRAAKRALARGLKMGPKGRTTATRRSASRKKRAKR